MEFSTFEQQCLYKQSLAAHSLQVAYGIHLLLRFNLPDGRTLRGSLVKGGSRWMAKMAEATLLAV